MPFIKTRRTIVAAALTGAILLGGGVAAFAYWTSTGGTGTGAATTGSAASSLVITQTAAPTDMAPGVAPGPITGTIQNTGASNAEVASVTVSISGVTQAVDAVGACTAADYTLATPVMAVGADLVPNATPTPFSGATLGFNDTGANQNGCQGATVNLAYVSS